MIQFLLSVAGFVTFTVFIFVAGVTYCLKTLNREAPDLFNEWKRRRAAK